MQVDDLRDFVSARDRQSVSHRVDAEVDRKFELAHSSKVNEEAKGPALLYQNAKGCKTPAFTSAFTTPARMAIALVMRHQRLGSSHRVGAASQSIGLARVPG